MAERRENLELREAFDGFKTRIAEHIRNELERDQLTGLRNLGALNRTLSGLVEPPKPDGWLSPPIDARKTNEFWIAFIEINRFKSVNDTFGHERADALSIGAVKLATNVPDTGYMACVVSVGWLTQEDVHDSPTLTVQVLHESSQGTSRFLHKKARIHRATGLVVRRHRATIRFGKWWLVGSVTPNGDYNIGTPGPCKASAFRLRHPPCGLEFQLQIRALIETAHHVSVFRLRCGGRR